MAEPLTQPRPHRRRVPRWVWFVAMCVALGAMTSVGVAWGIAWEYSTKRPARVRMPIQGRVAFARLQDSGDSWVYLWSLAPFHRTGEDVFDFNMWLAGSLLRHSDLELFEALTAAAPLRRAMLRHEPLLETTDAHLVHFTVVLSGWPLRCLSREEACTATFARSEKVLDLINGINRSLPDAIPKFDSTVDPAFNLLPHYYSFSVRDRLLPTYIMWPGLLANTAIYGGAWAVLIGGPILLRRWLRARRGGCPQCGYSREGLKVDAPCPECGRATPSAHDATETSTAR